MPMSRMFTMMLMLAIMGLIFVRLRDPNTWGWFARDNDEVQVVGESMSGESKQPSASRPADSAFSAGKNQPAPTPNPASSGGRPVVQPIPGQKAIDSGKTPAAGPQPPAPAVAQRAAGEGPHPKDSSTAAGELTATGPTDLDLDETGQVELDQCVATIKDGTMEMTKGDMAAYFQVLSWVDHQSLELLQKRAKRDVFYSDFRKTPDSMRLQIVDLKLNVKQIVRYTEPPKKGITKPTTTDEGHPLYEVRGFTKEGGSNLYIGVVTDLPEGMPIGLSVDEEARLVGYFFKLQGYISRGEQLEAERTGRRPVILKAPLILGRLKWVPSQVVADEKAPIWLLVAIGSVATVVIVGWVMLTTRRSRRPALPAIVPGASLDPEAPSVDNWLDHAQSGRLTLEPVPETTAPSDGAALDDRFSRRWSGNIIWENDESSNGHGANNGNGDSGPGGSDNPSGG